MCHYATPKAQKLWLSVSVSAKNLRKRITSAAESKKVLLCVTVSTVYAVWLYNSTV